jgi:hypothetical protein
MTQRRCTRFEQHGAEVHVDTRAYEHLLTRLVKGIALYDLRHCVPVCLSLDPIKVCARAV